MTPAKANAGELRVVIAAAGTGGHVYPAIAIARRLVERNPDAQILFIGTADRIESRIVPAAGFAFAPISVLGLRGRQPLRRLARSLWWLLSGRSLRQSLRLLRQQRPQVVIAMGGYVSGPVAVAARWRKIPRMTVEQNQHPGFTARATARMSQVLCVVSPQSADYCRELFGPQLRIEVTGNPVRSEVLTAQREQAQSALGLDPQRLTVLVTGGSIGSQAVNAAVSGALERLAQAEKVASRLQVLHLTGSRNPVHPDPSALAAAGLAYEAREYLDDMPLALAAADIIITRGGGTALAEITARGLPAIIIPWAAAADGEQEHNARPLAEAGAAVIIRDAELNPNLLAKVLRELIEDDERRALMARRAQAMGHPDAADRIAAIVEELAGRAQ